MRLNLVHYRFYSAVAQEIPEHLNIEVGDANTFDKAFVDECFHLGPHFMHGNIDLRESSILVSSDCDRPVDKE
jgi:hypothetical protein